jgi:hypothetical protein
MEYIKQLADITETDRNNCALNAMSIILSKPYYEVYKAFKEQGRVGGKGSSVRMIMTVLNVLKQGTPEKAINNWQMPTKLKLSLNTFAKQYPKGKYYVIKSKHALALIDGIWYDSHEPNPRSYVKYFFKVD